MSRTPEDADAASVNGQDLRADPSLRHLLCSCDVMSLPYCTMTTHLCPHPATRSQGTMPICLNSRMGWQEMGCGDAQGRLGGKGFSNLPACAGRPSGTCAYLCRCCVSAGFGSVWEEISGVVGRGAQDEPMPREREHMRWWHGSHPRLDPESFPHAFLFFLPYGQPKR